MRPRIAASSAVLVAIVLVIVSVVLVRAQRATLTDQLDDSLSTEADRIAVAAEQVTPIEPGDDDIVAAVFDAQGQLVTAVVDDDLDSSNVADALRRIDDDGGLTIDGDRYRAVSEEFDGEGGVGRVIVAGPTDDIDESVDDLVRSLSLIVPLALAALVIVIWFVVGRTLRPVEAIRTRVASIDVGALDGRVPIPPGGDELARLAETMNVMLERLDGSVRRQQRFVADASHELRTPLTRMRTELEVDERDPAHADVAATRRSQLQEIEGLQRMIEDLLLLARSDARGVMAARERVDLDDIVLDEARAHASSDVLLDISTVSAAQITGSRLELQRLVRNLVENAMRHAVRRVSIGLAEVDGTATLTVDDDGPGIAPEDRSRVLERFARLDESRTGGAHHAGLGLAIVDDIVRRHVGTLTIDESELGGARMTVRLPTDDVSTARRSG